MQHQSLHFHFGNMTLVIVKLTYMKDTQYWSDLIIQDLYLTLRSFLSCDLSAVYVLRRDTCNSIDHFHHLFKSLECYLRMRCDKP